MATNEASRATSPVRISIRSKILVFLLVAITTVGGTISFTMANFFQHDRQQYVNDWISIAAASISEETRTLLTSYVQRLSLYADIVLNDELGEESRRGLQRRFLDDLPDLVQVLLYKDGEVVAIVNNADALMDAGVGSAQLSAFRQLHPLPLNEIAAGQVYVANSSFTESLPSYTLAVPHEAAGGTGGYVVAAVLRIEPLQHLGAKFPMFDIQILDRDGRALAHPDVARVIQRAQAALPEGAETIGNGYRAGRTLQFTRGGVEMLGGYAGAGLAGVNVAVHIPRSEALLASRPLLQRLLSIALGLLAIVALLGMIWAQRITWPVERLSQATHEIARGEFDVQVDVDSSDEIGALAGSFNTMVTELKHRERALEEAHTKLIQSEKMSAFGQLGAGIAHEVKNPLAGILGCAQLSMMEVAEGSMVYQNLQLIERETERCKTIIENLLKFARQEKAHLELIEINPIVRDAAAIVRHQLEIHGCKLELDLDENIPQVHANSNQIQQVLINLFINAQQAIKTQGGRIQASTRLAENGRLEIRVKDNGPGMTCDVKQKLFEPFFTTKPVGKGTGLGLSVTFGIVKDHNGEIEVVSEPGQGAEFIICMPVAQMEALRHAELAAEASALHS